MYLPVKILEKKYADEMIAGRMMMRPLADFGIWKIGAKRSVNDSARKDVREGTAYVPDDNDKDEFFNSIPQDMKDVISFPFYINERDKYTRLFCMYRLQFNPSTNDFDILSSRMSELGDTAVIVTYPQEFLRRITNWCMSQANGLFIPSVGDIVYKSINKDKGYWGLWVKDESYSWQNEVRISAQLRPDIIGNMKDLDLTPWITDIGDISDIAVKKPIAELFNKRISYFILSEPTKALLKKAKSTPLGVCNREYVLFNDFSSYYPNKEYIDYYRKVLLKPDWIEITEMRQIVTGCKPVPILCFCNIDKIQKIVFLPDRVGLTLTEDNYYLLKDFIKIDAVKHKETYSKVSLVTRYNCGDINTKYQEYRALNETMNRDKIYDGTRYSEIINIFKAQMKERSVWGLDIPADRTELIYEISNDMSRCDEKAVYAGFCSMREIANVNIEHLMTKEDIYEQFTDV